MRSHKELICISMSNGKSLFSSNVRLVLIPLYSQFVFVEIAL